ncbi:Rrf2 family transcriptional regulator [Lactobacillus acidophilus]|uniref:Rrf2 family transcriptional regulator n=1 Tax=Lactobacillus acidophilus TaxID=1579 RepID=UPI0021A65781|nr:Rrf2 family transcriptional regulator [Lactobacillus acidophilus]MCT3601614.1 Rrf2 family transcriptional regulator [Lactobacillus acidophilus]MCT3624626.1 Rrf2 family transcriptional regulator [Lactobacillus acidophilus]
MKISTRFSDAIHLLAFIHIYKGKIPLTSENIAGSIETSPVMVRKLMGELRKAGLIETKHGTPDPKLAKSTDQTSLLDIYLAVEKNKPLFEIDHKTNPECIVGGNIQSTLAEYYKQAEVAAKAKLNDTKLSDVIDTILVKQKEKEYLKNNK